MRKVIGLVVLSLSLAVVGGATMAPPTNAQDKTKAKLKDKKEAATGTVEIYKAKDGYRFRIKNAEAKTMAIPARGRETKEEVASDLEDIKATLNKAKPTEIKD